jgi:hypothetical protein
VVRGLIRFILHRHHLHTDVASRRRRPLGPVARLSIALPSLIEAFNESPLCVHARLQFVHPQSM